MMVLSLCKFKIVCFLIFYLLYGIIFMYINFRKETYFMKKEIMVKDILQNLEREVLNSGDANFQFAVRYYLGYSTKHKFERSHFFDEFVCEPQIQQPLIRLYNLVGYSEFKKKVVELSKSVTIKLLNDKDTPYPLLAQLTEFVSSDYCEELARKNNFSHHYLFIITFKTLASCFMVPKDSRNVSGWNMKRCKLWVHKFSNPSEKILGILSDPAEALKVNVDDNWLINELVSSL